MGVSSGKSGFVSEINVTPFVDVMLVLLIIFMVTAPMLTQGIDVDLPQTSTVDVLPTDADNMVLTIKQDGSMYMDEYEVTLDTLPNHIENLVTSQNKQLFLRADKAVAYGVVVQVMGIVKGAGVSNLGVVADVVEPAAGTQKNK